MEAGTDLEVTVGSEIAQYDDGGPHQDLPPEYCRTGEECEDSQEYANTRDSVTGDVLPPRLVQKAHADEVELMKELKTEDFVLTLQAKQRMGKLPVVGK